MKRFFKGLLKFAFLFATSILFLALGVYAFWYGVPLLEGIVFVGPFVPQEREVMWLVRYALCVAAGAVALLAVVLFIRLRVKRAWFQFLLDTTASVLFLYMLVFSLLGWGEWYLFRHPHSSSNGLSLSAKLWGERFWGPTNSMGVRDAEFEYRGKDIVLVLGDSFAAGYGVGRDERFSGMLAKSFPNLDVWTLAECGWDTRRELEGLKTLWRDRKLQHVRTVVLSYFLNDIDGAAKIPVPFMNAGPYWARRSYVGDFVYQRLHAREINAAGQRYFDELLTAYEKDDSWEDHADDLVVLQDRCERRHMRLIVVIFPFPQARERSALPAKKVQQFFEHHGIEVVNMNDIIPKDQPIASLTANANDVHPSPELHREVADRLAKLISANGVTQFAKRHDDP